MAEPKPKLTPRLIVEGADDAIAFYKKTLGATLVERYFDDHIGTVVHAAISIDGAIVALAEQNPDWNNYGPSLLGGSAVVLELQVDDPDAVAARMVEAGAEIVFEIRDQFYGRREGRVQDPFGHFWILSKMIEELSPGEIERRIRAFHD